jgi:hypothetical protein
VSKNRYLYEDLRDLQEAYDRLALAMVEACKPLLIWLLDKLNGWIK